MQIDYITMKRSMQEKFLTVFLPFFLVFIRKMLYYSGINFTNHKWEVFYGKVCYQKN